ncbi:MAG: class I SAM-dependent methyltransferase, partial [Pseudonocardia sp.]|nr:class I SAM-dependent methyltransferase [Pseudonocardia sp.]
RADTALRLATRHIGMLWRGDYRNARQLLAALARRGGRRARATAPPGHTGEAADLAERFHSYRREQARRASVLGMLLVPVDPGYALPLRHAPDVRRACREVYPPVDRPAAVALRELLGVVGAHQWRAAGVEVPALGARIHPHYGVFSPTRAEYVELVTAARLPAGRHELAYDIGTGTGVLAAVLARRGVERVVATDLDPRAVACASDNVRRLGLADRVEVRLADLFPTGAGRAALVVCNPPWLPARAHTPLDHAVYDPDSRMLRGFLGGLGAHLSPSGEGWLVLSDLAELLGLRSRDELTAMIDAAGLRVVDRTSTRPRHPRATDRGDIDDPLRDARAAEVTSLWRLRRADR